MPFVPFAHLNLIFTHFSMFGLINRGGCFFFYLLALLDLTSFVGTASMIVLCSFCVVAGWLLSPGKIGFVWLGLTDEMDMGFSLPECLLGPGTRRPDRHLNLTNETN